jgi:hypothetical protein
VSAVEGVEGYKVMRNALIEAGRPDLAEFVRRGAGGGGLTVFLDRNFTYEEAFLVQRARALAKLAMGLVDDELTCPACYLSAIHWESMNGRLCSVPVREFLKPEVLCGLA